MKAASVANHASTGVARALLLRLALMFAVAVGAPGGVHAQALAVRDLAVLVDADATETIATASAPAARERYTPLTGSWSGGYTRAAVWLRFTVAVPAAGEWWLEVQPPFVRDLRLFEPTAAGFAERQSGMRLPFRTRELDYRGFVFKLALPDTAPRTFYLRVQTNGASLAPLQLWHPDRFRAAEIVEYASLGFWYGVMLLMLLFDLILWAWVRDALYGWCSLYIVANIQLYLVGNGLASQYLLRDLPAVADLWAGVAVVFLIVASPPFYRRMLRVERDQRVFFGMFRVQALLPCMLLPALFTGYQTEAVRIVLIYTMPMIVLLLYLAARLWRQGRHEAPYLMLAISLPLLGSVVTVLALLGIAPGDAFSINLRQYAVSGSLIAMQIALAVRLTESRRERLEMATRTRNAELDAANEREAHADQGRFVAMLSHELKTPLAVIDGAAQVLERVDRSNDPDVARRHQRIRRAVGRIDRVVEQFLSKDRLEAGGMRLRRSPIDVATMLHRVVGGSADGAGRLMLTVPAQLPLAADGALLAVAVGNLVENALKYTPPESTVDVSAGPHDENGQAGVEIIVADQGPGIPPGFRDRMFSRYTRGDNAGAVSGAGLGLYLVWRIAELHGGRVELLPRSGGATFRLWLPAVTEAAP